MIKITMLLFFALMLSTPIQADELLRPVSFVDAAQSGELLAGEVIENDTLRIIADPDHRRWPLIELAQPGVTSPSYALKGLIRYQGVEGDGYLQMDNNFGAKGTYFTKSLASTGPLRKLSGSSDWREFVLPFFANSGDDAVNASLSLERLSLSVYLPGAGTVFIRDMGLHQYAEGEDPLSPPGGQWFSNRAAGLTGAIGGSFIGIWGALIGFLAYRVKARNFAIGSSNLLVMIGIISLIAGLAALAVGQPYAVYFSLLLMGGLLVVVIGGIRRQLPHRYDAGQPPKRVS